MSLNAFFALFVIVHLLFFTSSVCFATELYRYKDEQGQWIFGDKRSLGNNTELQKKAEVIQVVNKAVVRIKPELMIKKGSGKSNKTWYLTNPLPVAVQHWLKVKDEKTFFTTVLAEPLQSLTLNPQDYALGNLHQAVEHFYLLGRPTSKPEKKRIPLPYLAGKAFNISQGFNGEYSHSGRGNRYAVDIAMPIGADITAVKEGVVADVQDHFSLGGVARYFLNKANHVTVMHADHSYAIYAHILHGSAAVKLGDRVKVGDVLARVGNTGFSTGPHLHFVMRYNSGNGSYSIPFQFITENGIQTPMYNQSYRAR